MGTDLLGRVELKPGNQLLAIGLTDPTLQLAQQWTISVSVSEGHKFASPAT